jgi:predicted dehydrogenase
MRATRALIVGAGGSGLLHAFALRAHGAVIEAVFDPDPERARSLAELVGARAVRALDMLDASRAEVVAICSPPRVHAEQAQRFARRERILLVEKPIALNDIELAALERIEGCVPMLQWRFGRSLRAVRRAIQWGELGPHPTVNVDLAWHRDDDYFAAGRGARATWGCGALLSIGIHAVDAVLFALGSSVQSIVGTLVERASLDVEVGAALVLVTTSGANVTLRLSLDAARDTTRMTFCGNGVTATIIGTEEDPTASCVEWSAADPAALRRLRSIENDEPGFTTGPLLVPLIGAALGRPMRRTTGRGPEELAVPSVRSVAPAHRAIFALYAEADRRGRNQDVSDARAVDAALSSGP